MDLFILVKGTIVTIRYGKTSLGQLKKLSFG